MIVVDTSALIAIALDEVDAAFCMTTLHRANRRLISAATLTEVMIVSGIRRCECQMLPLLPGFGFEIEPVTHIRALAAAGAYRRYGKGYHPAALNFGDSFAYALAIEQACPLLYVGDDFARTDIERAE